MCDILLNDKLRLKIEHICKIKLGYIWSKRFWVFKCLVTFLRQESGSKCDTTWQREDCT